LQVLRHDIRTRRNCRTSRASLAPRPSPLFHDFCQCGATPQMPTIARISSSPITGTAMNLRRTAIPLACLVAFALPAFADDEPSKDTKETKTETKTETTKPEKLAPKQVETDGTVTVEGKTIEYKAVAGTIILEDKKDVGTASIFYAYYAK